MNPKKYMKTFKNRISVLKPSIKGAVMVILGILNTRMAVGIGRLTINLILGTVAYLFVALSGLVVIEIIRSKQESGRQNRFSLKQLRVISVVLLAIGVLIEIYHSVVYNIGLFPIILCGIIGISWFLLGFYAPQDKRSKLIIILIISLNFTLGIIFGALLNDLVIPTYIWFFFFTATYLQISREIVKKTLRDEGGNGKESKNKTEDRVVGEEKALKMSLLFQFLAILFLFLPIFVNLNNPFLFLFPMIIGLIIMNVAITLTFRNITGKSQNKNTISRLLKVSIMIELLAFLWAA